MKTAIIILCILPIFSYSQEGYKYLNILGGYSNKKSLAFHIGWLSATPRYNAIEVYFEGNIPPSEKEWVLDTKNTRYFGGLSYHKNITRSKNVLFNTFVAMKAGGKEKTFLWGPSAGFELGIFVGLTHMLSISSRNDYFINEKQFYHYLMLGYKIPL
jgi:hypothetical protein